MDLHIGINYEISLSRTTRAATVRMLLEHLTTLEERRGCNDNALYESTH